MLTPAPTVSPVDRVKAQVGRPVQVFYVHQIGRRPEAIPHADEYIGAAQEGARLAGVFGQKLAGFSQRSWFDIIKFWQAWMCIVHKFTPSLEIFELSDEKKEV